MVNVPPPLLFWCLPIPPVRGQDRQWSNTNKQWHLWDSHAALSILPCSALQHLLCVLWAALRSPCCPVCRQCEGLSGHWCSWHQSCCSLILTAQTPLFCSLEDVNDALAFRWFYGTDFSHGILLTFDLVAGLVLTVYDFFKECKYDIGCKDLN